MVAEVLLDLVVKLQEGVPLVQGDALVRGGLEELDEVVQVRRAVGVQHDGQQTDDNLLLCVACVQTVCRG